MIERIPRLFLIAGIVTAAFGCDNVSWGGMSLSLEGPERDSLALEPGDPGYQPPGGPPRMEYGPLLYAGVREADSALIFPVAELVDKSLSPLPGGDDAVQLAEQVLEERLFPGRELTVFHQGARIGSLIVSSPLGTTSDYCSPRAQAVGQLELVPSAAAVQRFLALEEAVGEQWPYGPFEVLVADRAHRSGIQNLGGEALNELGAPWPGGLQNIRQDLQVFQHSTDSGPSIIGTFLFQDQMGIGPAPEESYSLMVIGEPRGNRYDRTYTWYRPVGEEGKGAPRFFSALDWDDDGEKEIILEVFGADSRWWAGLDNLGGAWSLVFQDPCGTPEGTAPTEVNAQGGSG